MNARQLDPIGKLSERIEVRMERSADVDALYTTPEFDPGNLW